VVTTNYTIRALHGGSETALGYVTVSVDTSQCVQQPKQDVVNSGVAQFAIEGAFTLGFQQNGYTLMGQNPSVSITLGLITFNFTGTLPAYAVTIQVKGSFGLTVDLTADALAPVNESSHVSCSGNALAWATLIGAGAGGIFGGIGAAIGAAVGAIAGAVTMATIIHTVSNKTKAAMPAIFEGIVQKFIAGWFNEPAGMAMAAVSIDPDPASPPDGNVTVTYCPKL
jgi:hypothetical protein